jgi:hypothetical protein
MADQYSALRVKLSDLIEGLEFQSDERFSFLNLTIGEVVSITDEELRAAENDELSKTSRHGSMTRFQSRGTL